MSSRRWLDEAGTAARRKGFKVVRPRISAGLFGLALRRNGPQLLGQHLREHTALPGALLGPTAGHDRRQCELRRSVPLTSIGQNRLAPVRSFR